MKPRTDAFGGSMTKKQVPIGEICKGKVAWEVADLGEMLTAGKMHAVAGCSRPGEKREGQTFSTKAEEGAS